MELQRRHFLTLAAAIVLTGCAPRSPGPTGTTVPPSPTPSPAPVAPDWAALGRSLGDRLLRPGSAGYPAAVPTRLPLFDSATPTAIIRAASAADIAETLTFAAASALPVTVRAGGHNYTGWSSGGGGTTGVPEAMVIDVSAINHVTMEGDRVRIGAGAHLGEVYAALAAQGRAIGAGSCGTVAVGGLVSGGGQGVLARSFGLAADQVESVTIVTGDAQTRTATASSEPDLFWAVRGGGGALLGVATEFTLRTQPAPQVTMLFYTWTPAQAQAVLSVWQDWAPKADPRLWTSLKILGGSRHPAGLSVSMSGTWTGPDAELDAVFAPFFAAIPAPATKSAIPRSYGDAMARYAGKPVRESFVATSAIAQRPLSRSEASEVIAAVRTAVSTSGITEGGVSFDAMGGKIAATSTTDTPFPHRDGLFIAQYSANFADGSAPAPFHQALAPLRALGVAAWGNGAYVNYPDASLPDPAASYFGDNAARLAQIADHYDPHHTFPAFQLGR